MTQLIILGVLVVASIGLIIYGLMPKRPGREEQVLRRVAGRRSDGSGRGGRDKAEQSAARQMLDKVTPYAVRPAMPKSDAAMTTLREKLAQAGFRQESASGYFLASKTLVGLIFAVGGLLLSLAKGYDMMHLLGAVAFGGGLGFMLPNFWLSMAQRQRRDKIRRGLPDGLDLLVVCVESGLALDAGIQKVADDMKHVHTELSEEMQIATLETQMGVPRAESLEHMARRCGVEEVRSLVAVITQAEKFGTSVAKALRTQAETLRTKRRLEAEERAQKTTVKLMLPLVLFIFPSIFVVLVGPAALRIIDAMSGSGALAR